MDVLCSKLEGLALGSAACAEAADTIGSMKVDVQVDSHGQDPSHSLGAVADDTIDNMKVKVDHSLCAEGDTIDHLQMTADFTHVQVTDKVDDVPVACYTNFTTAAPGVQGSGAPKQLNMNGIFLSHDEASLG